MDVVLKRVYEKPGPDDGYRMLVDRLWPRGVSKQRAELDEWAKDLAPTTELREWFGHDPARFDEFAERSRAELEGNPAVDAARAHQRVTLLYAARDPLVNHAVVLRDYLLAGWTAAAASRPTRTPPPLAARSNAPPNQAIS